MRWRAIAVSLLIPYLAMNARKDFESLETFFPRPGPCPRSTAASNRPSFQAARGKLKLRP
jgi:hypothetical protein